MSKVKWGDEEVENCWRFQYLGSLQQAEGEQLPDIDAHIAMTKARSVTLHHVWAAELPLDLKLRLYISVCCSMMTYGAEAWLLNEVACRRLNDANAYMLSHITGKIKREEATTETTSFDIIAWIRARRLCWAGHILRLNEKRLVHQALHHIHDNPQPGDMLMDVPSGKTWELLKSLADDRDAWRSMVHALKEKAKKCTVRHSKDKQTKSTTILNNNKTTRFTYFPKKRTTNAVKNKKPKKLSNVTVRQQFYTNIEKRSDAYEARQTFFEPRKATQDKKKRTTTTWAHAKELVFSSSENSNSAITSFLINNTGESGGPRMSCVTQNPHCVTTTVTVTDNKNNKLWAAQEKSTSTPNPVPLV